MTESSRIDLPGELLDTPLLAAARHLDRPAVVGADRVWTWRDIHAAAIAFARRLDEATAVCNLCTSRVAFLVTLIAALRRQRLTVLPPSGGNADLAGILGALGRPLIVADDARAIQPGWRQAAECLVCKPSSLEVDAIADAELAWQPAWGETSILLYTSGSTGTPEPQTMTLLHLAIGALVLGDRLSRDVAGGLASLQRIVCSVPPQHMFGVEASVMLSLVHATPVLDRRPLLPADVQDAFAQSPPAVWIATPLHLRSLVQMDLSLPNCSAVIASTMPLPQGLAQQTEELVHAPVLEIYGSTETGVLAMRRSARDADWRPVRGVQIVPIEDGASARGSHFASPVKLLDRIDIGADGRFALLGRQADLVKIAGRRASLAGLNLLLQDMPGFEDGVFYLPATGRPTERLCLIHTAAALDRATIEQWLRTRLDPAFLPRTIIRVERLPRSDSGKLPRQALDQLYEAWRAGDRR
jgi:acyl-coenzyme A synthetase/AMP-(fatty) acid ligase